MMKNIVLVGFMGAGKSVVGKNLAREEKRSFVSTDELIVMRENRSINDIFKDSGEDYFRKVEKAVVAEVGARSSQVIDCGGGVVLNEENIKNLRKNGIVFYLRATPEVIYQRVKGQHHRPLLKVENPQKTIKELLQLRSCFYEKSAHYIIDTSIQSVEQIVGQIQQFVSHD